MNILNSLAMRSRHLGEVAQYVPGYDAKVLTGLDWSMEGDRVHIAGDLLADLAENAHRLFSISSNVGNIGFLYELSSTLSLYVPQIFEALLKVNLIAQEMFDSCEITDECFSAFQSFLSLKEIEQEIGETANAEIRRLEVSLASPTNYNQAVYRNYVRLKRLLERFLGLDRHLAIIVLNELFFDAARVGPDERFSCDERFDFFLTSAERGLEKGIPIDNLQKYWTESGQTVGYKIWPDLIHDSRVLESVFDELTLGGKIPITPEGRAELEKRYSAILETRKRDRVLWDERTQTAAIGKPNAHLLDPFFGGDRTVVESSIILLGDGSRSRWQFRAKKREDSLEKHWAQHAFTTIYRNALITNESECPLSAVSEIDRCLCAPISEESCVFRRFKENMR